MPMPQRLCRPWCCRGTHTSWIVRDSRTISSAAAVLRRVVVGCHFRPPIAVWPLRIPSGRSLLEGLLRSHQLTITIDGTAIDARWDAEAAARRLFGVPVAVSIAEDEGVAHLFATGAVALDTDTLGVQVAWSETSNADDFSRNLIRAKRVDSLVQRDGGGAAGGG